MISGEEHNVPPGTIVCPLGRYTECRECFSCVGEVSFSTLVSEERLLCSDEASLSCDPLFELLDSKLLLGCLGMWRSDPGVLLLLMRCTCDCTSGDTIESRIRLWLADGGDTS